MTASLGVGLAKAVGSAKQHIMAICANMDADCIQTVERNKKELREFVKEPEESQFLFQI